MAGTEITLVLGGARSGKSLVAERLAARLDRRSVTYLATGGAPASMGRARADHHLYGQGDPPDASTPVSASDDRDASDDLDDPDDLDTPYSPDDRDWAQRIARHRRRRPASWSTVEIPVGGDLPAALANISGTVLVDSLGTWVAGMMGNSADGAGKADSAGKADEAAYQMELDVAVDALCSSLAERSALGSSTILVSDEVGLSVHPSTDLGRKFRDALGDVNRAVAGSADRVLLVVAGRGIELFDPLADSAGFPDVVDESDVVDPVDPVGMPRNSGIGLHGQGR